MRLARPATAGEEIAAYLTRLLADERFAAATPVAPAAGVHPLLGLDVAVAHTYIERAGQAPSRVRRCPWQRAPRAAATSI